MLNSQQQEHIRRKVEQVSILISVLQANFFSNITQKEFADLSVLYSSLKGPLEKLESKIKPPIQIKPKKKAKPLQVGIAQLSQFFENAYSQEKITGKELFSNLFLYFNLYELVFEVGVPKDFDQLISFANKCLQKLSAYLEDKKLIESFNQVITMGYVRAWADLKDFPEKEACQCFLYMFDLYLDKENLKSQSFFITTLVNPIALTAAIEPKAAIDSAPVPPPRKKNANVKQPENIDVTSDSPVPPIAPPRNRTNKLLQERSVRSVAPLCHSPLPPIPPPRRNRTNNQLEHLVASVAPLRPIRAKKPVFFTFVTTSNESNVVPDTESNLSNTPSQ